MFAFRMHALTACLADTNADSVGGRFPHTCPCKPFYGVIDGVSCRIRISYRIHAYMPSESRFWDDFPRRRRRAVGSGCIQITSAPPPAWVLQQWCRACMHCRHPRCGRETAEAAATGVMAVSERRTGGGNASNPSTNRLRPHAMMDAADCGNPTHPSLLAFR